MRQRKKEVNIKTEEILQALSRKDDIWFSVASAATFKATILAISQLQFMEQKSAEAIRKSKDIIIKLNNQDIIKKYC